MAGMRIALGITYNGQAYQGWQSQPSGNTVQDHLEAALGRFAASPISTICAGRTDAGVHGLMQVVHFDAPVERTDASWVRGTNTFLPKDIAVQWARAVSDEFHSRACATSRRYGYALLQSPVRPSVESGRVGWVFQPLQLAESLFQIGSEGEGLVHCTVVIRELAVAQRVEHRKRKSIRAETDG